MPTVTAGEQLRKIREGLGLTVRAVETASGRIAERHGNPEYSIPISRLSDIETKGVLPNLYRLYSLAVIYRQDYQAMLEMFGIELGEAATDSTIAEIPQTHPLSLFSQLGRARVPIELDPSFDPASTTSIGRMIVSWGTVPLHYLKRFSEDRSYTYALVGSGDWTMYPLVLPGSFLQVDESKTVIASGPFKSEYERPIYFLETRQGFTCSWCELNGKTLTLVPHPMSPVPIRSMLLETEVEVLGQVVGLAMRLDGWNGIGPK